MIESWRTSIEFPAKTTTAVTSDTNSIAVVLYHLGGQPTLCHCYLNTLYIFNNQSSKNLAEEDIDRTALSNSCTEKIIFVSSKKQFQLNPW